MAVVLLGHAVEAAAGTADAVLRLLETSDRTGHLEPRGEGQASAPHLQEVREAEWVKNVFDT